MPTKRILAALPGVTRTVIESIRLEEGALVVGVSPRKGQRRRCPHCNRRSPVHDRSPSPHRWRTLDLGPTKTCLEYRTLRVRCPVHGAVTAAVPWADHASRFARAFEQQVAWLCVHCNRSAVARLMRTDWKSVGAVCARVYDALDAEAGNRLDGPARIGIDETSYEKGRKYMTVVLDHDTGRVVWCGRGRGKEVLRSFFALPSASQRESIEVVTADSARWIADAVAECRPNAERAMDPFHVVSWMTDVLDEARKTAWREAREAEPRPPRRGRGRPGKGEEMRPRRSDAVKGSRYSLLKNPEDLTDGQRAALERIAREDRRLYRAHLMKERLRDVFGATDGETAARRLDSWLASACHGGVAALGELSKKIRRHREAIVRSVALGISNARVEAINNKIKLTVRMGYGFRNVDNLIALIMLRCSNLPIALPGRAPAV